VNKRFDSLQKTLVSVRNAKQTPDVEGEPPRIESDQVVTTTAVTTDRVKIRLPQKTGSHEKPVAVMVPPPIQPPPPTTRVRSTAAVHPAVDEQPTTATHPAVDERPAVAVLPAADERPTAATRSIRNPNHTTATPPPESPITPANIPETVLDEIDAVDYFEPDPPPVPRNETAAVLRAKMTPRPKKSKGIPLPDDMISMTFRLPRYMRDALVKMCNDDGRDVAKVLRGLIKRHCQL